MLADIKGPHLDLGAPTALHTSLRVPHGKVDVDACRPFVAFHRENNVRAMKRCFLSRSVPSLTPVTLNIFAVILAKSEEKALAYL